MASSGITGVAMAQLPFVILDSEGKVLANRDTGEHFVFATRTEAEAFLIHEGSEKAEPGAVLP
jgi:hypothetical protein